MAHHPVGVQLHLHGLARALGVPDDARLAVALHGLDGATHRLGHGEVLVGLGDPLLETFRPLVECREVAQQLKEPLEVEDPVDEELQPGAQVAVTRLDDCGNRLAVVVDVPGREVVQRRERRAVLREQAVTDDRQQAEPERHRELADVRLDLRMRGAHVGLLGAGPLELDDHERQPVDVEHDVEAPLVLARTDGHLVDREVLVLLDSLAQQPDRRGLLDPVGVDVGDAAVAVHQVLVDPVVLGQGVLRLRRQDVGQRLLKVWRRHRGVQPDHRLTGAARNAGIGPGLALAGPRGDLAAVQRFPLPLGERLESQLLPLALVEPVDASHYTTPSTAFSASLTRTFPDISSGNNASRVSPSTAFSSRLGTDDAHAGSRPRTAECFSFGSLGWQPRASAA